MRIVKTNNFKNITVLVGNVQLSPGDTYQHFFTTGSTQIVGGLHAVVQATNCHSGGRNSVMTAVMTL